MITDKTYSADEFNADVSNAALAAGVELDPNGIV